MGNKVLNLWASRCRRESLHLNFRALLYRREASLLLNLRALLDRKEGSLFLNLRALVNRREGLLNLRALLCRREGFGFLNLRTSLCKREMILLGQGFLGFRWCFDCAAWSGFGACWRNVLSGSNLSAFTASGRGLLHLLSVDLSALIRVSQAPFFVIVVVIQNKFPERWHAIIIVRKIGSALAFVVIQDSKIFYPDDLVLLLDVYSINCVTIVADQGALQSPWCPLLRFSCLFLFV